MLGTDQGSRPQRQVGTEKHPEILPEGEQCYLIRTKALSGLVPELDAEGAGTQDIAREMLHMSAPQGLSGPHPLEISELFSWPTPFCLPAHTNQ